jgi:Zn ribbon nucleic-acid-binding protein
MAKCPKCGSKNIKFYSYLGIKTIKCSNCGFDESSAYEVYPEQKTSQKAKGKYSPYKTGGSQRTRKK